MSAALAIAARDLRQKVRDRSVLIIALAAPLGLALLFSLMLPGDGSSFRARYVVVDLDGGPLARALREGPLEGLVAAGVAQIESRPDVAGARAAVEGGTVDAALVIPGGFSASAEGARAARVDVIASPRAALAAGVLRSALEGFASRVEGVQLAVATALESSHQEPQAEITAELVERARSMPSPIAIVEASTADRVAGDDTFYAASMAVLFVFFAAQFGVLSLLTEKRTGTLARMLAAPVAPRTILLGKLLVSFILASFSVTAVWLVTTALMGARWGDPAAVVALILGISLAASGISLLVVSFARNEDQAGGLAGIVAISLAVLGGSFFQMTQAPEGLARLSLLTPHAWFMRGVNDLAGGGGLATVLPTLAVLVGVGVVTTLIGLARARRLVLAR